MRGEWQERGILKTPRKGWDLSFWRVVLVVNWARDWTWADVLHDGDLKSILAGITVTRRIGSRGDILNCYGLTLFKLTIAFGWA